jgi:hypothetical protein
VTNIKISKEKLKQIIKEELKEVADYDVPAKDWQSPPGLEASAKQFGLALQEFKHTDTSFVREIWDVLEKFDKGVAQAFRDGFNSEEY